MKPTRRWFQYSLRSFLVVLTASAVWLGVVVNRAREQREAVKAIEAMGGSIIYDWQKPIQPEGVFCIHGTGEPRGLTWLRQLIGDDFFQEVVAVNVLTTDGSKIDESYVRALIPCLQKLQGLKAVYHHPGLSEDTKYALTTALPKCSLEFGWWK